MVSILVSILFIRKRSDFGYSQDQKFQARLETTGRIRHAPWHPAIRALRSQSGSDLSRITSCNPCQTALGAGDQDQHQLA
jgi:hypothetical protein